MELFTGEETGIDWCVRWIFTTGIFMCLLQFLHNSSCKKAFLFHINLISSATVVKRSMIFTTNFSSRVCDWNIWLFVYCCCINAPYWLGSCVYHGMDLCHMTIPYRYCGQICLWERVSSRVSCTAPCKRSCCSWRQRWWQLGNTSQCCTGDRSKGMQDYCSNSCSV